MNTLIWVGIIFCITQSAMFSGLNLAFFSVSKLSLEIESKKNNPSALKVARLRQDSNFLLTTILWGNVGINVLLTLLSNSVMVGAVAFIFSTFIIDDFVKSPKFVMPDLIRHPESTEITGFRLPPE